MKLSEVKVGDSVEVGIGFSCMKTGRYFVKGEEGSLYIECEEGEHYLSGQEDENGNLIGISHAPPS